MSSAPVTTRHPTRTDAPAGPSPEQATRAANALVTSVCSVVRGNPSSVQLIVCALISGGHVLVEDLPGTGKTTMARAVARSIGGSFGRVQATADLMPSDVTGSGIWEPNTGNFRFIPGPIFAHILVIDELNRTSPRTQSAFMEALDEGAVTVDGVRHPLPDPFFAIATQNPAEHHGTFALPEGELDRFAISVSQAELDLSTEISVVREQLTRPTVDDLQPVLSPAILAQLRTSVRQTHVSAAVLGHAVQVVRSTRGDARLRAGASSRAALALVRTAQAHAILAGRNYVTPDDTKAVAVAVLAHRLHPLDAGLPAATVVADLLSRVPIPLEA